MAYDALYTGISGLNAYQAAIDLISNNIANASTNGFKSQRMTFTDAFYQQQGTPSAPSQTKGGTNGQDTGTGVKIGSIDTNFSQGGLQTTGINTDMAINGDGFFILNNINGSGTPLYTRNGAFSINTSGLLYDPASGLAVQGYMANNAGTITSTGTPGPITIPIGLAEQATATGGAGAVKIGPANDKSFDMSFGGSLDQTQYAAEAATPGTGLAKTLSTTVYDSLGNAHQATFTITPVGPNTPPATPLPATVNDPNGNAVAPASRYQYTVSFADGSTPSAATGYLFFDQNGQFINTAADAAGTQVHTVGTAPSNAQGDAVNIATWGAGAAGNGALASTVALDFSNMSSLAGSSTASILDQNGFPPGILSNITVGQDGSITGSFTNGQQKTLAQVALATFQNEDGLHRVAGGFQQTANSGLAQVGTANQGRYGGIVADALEQSNVSLAEEFTKLIVAQRAFEANSRGISTADQNLMTVVNMRSSEN